MLENDELQLGDIIAVHPVLRRLSYKVLLGATSSRVALNWVTLGADQIVKLGEFDDEGIVIILEKGLRFESSSKHRLQIPLGLFLRRLLATVRKFSVAVGSYVMFLDDLLKASVIQLGELG